MSFCVHSVILCDAVFGLQLLVSVRYFLDTSNFFQLNSLVVCQLSAECSCSYWGTPPRLLTYLEHFLMEFNQIWWKHKNRV